MNPKLQVLATKSFSRWMRKNKIAHKELFSAASEMAEGLIDADLGGHVVKNGLQWVDEAGDQVLEPLSQPILGTSGFTYLDLKKTREATLTHQNSKPCKN